MSTMVYRCTETTLTSYGHLYRDKAAWQATLDWLRFHGIDPDRIPAEQTIVRDVANCRVIYDEIEFDGEVVIRRVHAQGEAPPMPFPAELVREEDA